MTEDMTTKTLETDALQARFDSMQIIDGNRVEVAMKLAHQLERQRDEARAVIAQHDLCHNLHGKVDAAAFAEGCATEQRKLYGCAPDADLVATLTQRLAGVERERDEREGIKLAAISTASVQNTRASAQERITKEHPYYTVAYADVCVAVDREMRERERATSAESLVTSLSAALRELVRLDTLGRVLDGAADETEELSRLRADYDSNWPLAWKAAFDLVDAEDGKETK